MNSQRSDEKRLRALVTKIVRERHARYGVPQDQVNIGWPVFDEKEILNALDSLLAMRISQGAKVREFEQLCARYIGRTYAVAVNSGSSANLLALTALIVSGDVPRGSEVIIPATTFATVASPIIQTGLVPVYVDVDPHSYNIDVRELEKAIGPKTRVIMPVHTFGNPADMRPILALAKKHKLLVLEDCCEAHGAAINGKKVGSFGDLATLSFFVAHNITTGEGGMVFTNSKKYRDILHSLREFGRLPPEVATKHRFTYPDKVLKNFDARYIFTRVGYNVRMTDIAASLGIEQIKKLDRFNTQRLKTVRTYTKALERYERYLVLPSHAKNAFHSFYGYAFLVREDAPFSRLDLVRHLEKHGIETRPFFGGSLPDQPAFRHEVKRIVGRLPVARMIARQSIFIGCHSALTPQHVQRVIDAFDSFFSRLA